MRYQARTGRSWYTFTVKAWLRDVRDSGDNAGIPAMPGLTILHYEFLEKIGAGGMGEVFKAHDKRLNRFVAIKALPYARSGDPDRRKRFMQEAQTASSLNHPNIITIHDIFQEGDTHYIVMEYVAGRTLLELIPPNGMQIGQVLLYAAQMADALRAAHEAGIIHRDFKPANVMVTSSGLVKVLDFGLAKLLQPQGTWMTNAAGASGDSATIQIGNQLSRSSGPQTAEGSILGTVNYMSPEQAEGKSVDGRSDIFSLGAVVYEMATGRRAFQGDSDIATLSAVLRDEVRPMSQLVEDVPHEFEELINVCLRKDPNARPQTMKEVQVGLSGLKRRWDAGAFSASQAALAAAPVAPKSALPAVAGPTRRLNKTLVFSIAGILVLLIAGAAVWFSLRGRHREAPSVAQVQPAGAPQPVAVEPQPSTPAPEPVAPSSDVPPPPTPGLPAVPKKIVPPPVVVPEPAFPDSKPATPQAAGTTGADAAKAPKPEAPRIPAQVSAVNLGDGVPFRIALAVDVPSDAKEGQTVTFRAADDVKAGDVVVIAKGATVLGEIVNGNGKKFLGMGGKMTFKLTSVEAADGQKIPVRASAAKRADGPTTRPVDTGKYAKSKDLAAARGTDYVAYIDGDQAITLRK